MVSFEIRSFVPSLTASRCCNPGIAEAQQGSKFPLLPDICNDGVQQSRRSAVAPSEDLCPGKSRLPKHNLGDSFSKYIFVCPLPAKQSCEDPAKIFVLMIPKSVVRKLRLKNIIPHSRLFHLTFPLTVNLPFHDKATPSNE